MTRPITPVTVTAAALALWVGLAQIGRDDLPTGPVTAVAEAPTVAAAGTWTWPARGRLGDRFGWSNWRGRNHDGIDLAAPTGTPVVAAASGRVVFAGSRGGYGLTVDVDHGHGHGTRYGHLSRITVTVGQHLAGGQGLGLVGSTGNSTGPHLHFELHHHGRPTDPLTVLPPRS